MTSPNLRVRRATIDDLNALRTIWVSMRLPADELEKRLKEFQVVENKDGQVLGAMGIEFSKQYALLHNEGFSDFSIADAARQLFWERIQTLASNHGVFRIWTQETSPFWMRWGFQPAGLDTLARLPEQWQTRDGKWFTLQLKNEEAIVNAMEKEFTTFMMTAQQDTARTLDKARTLNTIIIVIGFAIGILGIAVATYLFIHQRMQ